MSAKFLVAVDGSEHGWKAVDMATELAKLSDAELVILHVVPHEPMPAGLERFAEVERIPLAEQRGRYYDRKAMGDRITEMAEARVREKGLTRVTTQVAEGSPADEIVGLADTVGMDMVFVGSRGLGDVKSLLLGSVSHKVLNSAPCTCVAVK